MLRKQANTTDLPLENVFLKLTEAEAEAPVVTTPAMQK